MLIVLVSQVCREVQTTAWNQLDIQHLLEVLKRGARVRKYQQNPTKRGRY